MKKVLLLLAGAAVGFWFNLISDGRRNREDMHRLW